jgi:4-amino-4-deoxy-L-arabinose transferase-like glycosyltransferase
VLSVISVAVIIWQFAFVLSFADVDTDAYVHHSIARQIILTPKDLSMHWVWLPLFHYYSSAFIIFGAGIDTIRIINIFIWELVSVILFLFMYKKENNLLIAFVSSLVCILFPIGVLMGTTAQPEPLFSLLILLFSIAADRNKILLSSIILTLACLLRYEAWIIIIVIFFMYLAEIRKEKKILNKKLILLLIPCIFIIIWALLREPFDGRLFGFLFQTQQFANDALKESNSFQGGIFKITLDLFHYPIIIPALFMGINLVFALLGFKEGTKSNKWIIFPGIGILTFITLSWMFKSNLGLNRHFVSLIPMYSILTAYGVDMIINKIKKKNENTNPSKYKKLKFSILILVLINCSVYIIMWLSIWNNNYEAEYLEKKTTATYLQSLPGEHTIFCNDAMVEILSKIDYKRFNRTWMENNPGITELIIQKAKEEGYVYVIISEDKWVYIKNFGEIIYSSPANKNTNKKILVVKVIY